MISNEPMVFPVGSYSVDDISLLDANNVVTHSVPHINDPIGNLAFFEDDILPMEITITPNAITESFVILLCNNTKELEELTSISDGFIGAMYETHTAWIYVPEDSCVNRVIINIGGYEVEVLIDQPGYYSAQYVWFEGLVRFEAYRDDQFLQVWHGVNDLNILPNGCDYPL